MQSGIATTISLKISVVQRFTLFICYLLLTGILSVTTYAQQRQVKGRVLDSQDNTPIGGAGVMVKDARKGTLTDAGGYFYLNASAGAVISVNFVGYETAETTVSGDTLTVLLKKDQRNLNEVVVTALGISKQSKAIGYAVQTLDNKSLTTAPDPNLVNDMAGKIAGVYITNGGAGAGSTSRIVIRGENSFSGTNQPLFVVDGVPINNETYFNNAIENASTQGTWAEVDWGNGAAEINPADIESMSVLKGATAAALYGSRAANGAIVLTTRKGKRSRGEMGVSVNSSVTMETPLRLPHLQNQYGEGNGTVDYHYVNGTNSFENNVGNWGKKFDPSTLVVQYNSPNIASGNIAAGTYLAGDVTAMAQYGLTAQATPWVGHSDHFKNFLQTGFTNSNNVSVSGADENGSYRLSFSNMHNTGLLPNTDLNRYSLSFRADHRFNDRLTSNVFINYINSGSDNRPNIGYGSESVMYSFFGVYGMPINVDINDLKNKQWQAGQNQVKQFNYWTNHDNPYVTMYDNTNSFKKNRLLGNASLKYEITPELSVMARTGTDYYADNREGHRAFGTLRFPTGGFRTDNVSYFENNTDVLVTYNRHSNGRFHFNVSGGGNRFTQNISYVENIANSLISPGLYSFTNAQTTLPPLIVKQNKVMYSMYAFGDVDYKKLLFLNITARNDWSSTLPAGNNSYFYPSASLSAVISDMVHLPASITYLKARVSGAQVGRDANPYSINNTYLTNTPYGSYPLTTANNVLANSNLKPSTTSTGEAGVEVRFLNNRIGLDATVYTSTTKNEIVQLPVPVSSGYTNAYVNGGKIGNKGIEIMLTANPVRAVTKDGFNWTTAFNFSHNRGKVLALPDGISTYKYADVTQYDRYQRSIQYNAIVGERMGNMYGQVFKRDGQGNIVYANGVPVLTGENDRRLLGNYNPDFILGWTNEFTYKKFTLNFTWDWHKGGKFFSYTELGLLNGGMAPSTLAGRDGTITGKGVMMDATSGKYVANNVALPAASYYLGYYNADNSEPFMVSASYLKLREVRLGYTFSSVFGASSHSSLNVSFVARNVLLFTQNKDIDPETLALRGTQIVPGTEFLSIPSSRSMGVSVGLNF